MAEGRPRRRADPVLQVWPPQTGLQTSPHGSDNHRTKQTGIACPKFCRPSSQLMTLRSVWQQQLSCRYKGGHSGENRPLWLFLATEVSVCTALPLPTHHMCRTSAHRSLRRPPPRLGPVFPQSDENSHAGSQSQSRRGAARRGVPKAGAGCVVGGREYLVFSPADGDCHDAVAAAAAAGKKQPLRRSSQRGAGSAVALVHSWRPAGLGGDRAARRGTPRLLP